MEILIPSLISALALGAFCCPALAQPADYLLSGGTITTIPTFDLTAVPGWWLSGGFTAHPAGTIATLALLFLISLLFFSMEQAKGCGEDGGVLGSARIKTGTELVRGSVIWDSKASPKARGFAYGFTKGKYLFEPERHVLLDGSTGSGKTRFCLIPTIDLLTYGDGANGSEPVSIAVTNVKNELIEITGPSWSGAATMCCCSTPRTPIVATASTPSTSWSNSPRKVIPKGRNRRRTPSPWRSSQRSAGRAPLTGRSRHGAAAPR